MNRRGPQCLCALGRRPGERGTILVVVLLIALGLVAITLYFADTMVMEYRGAENSMAGMQAEQVSAGARRYLLWMLAQQTDAGRMPDIDTYEAENVPVGDDGAFWLIGRDPNITSESGAQTGDRPTYGLIDEASKLNLNTASLDMLEALPGMTAEAAEGIMDWRDADDEPTTNGAETQTYLLNTTPYNAKNYKFESPEELRLVHGVDWTLMVGEDANRNGFMEPNENDGSASPPDDNQDGKLDPGLLEYVTVWSREPNTQSDGTARINITRTQSQQALRTLLTSSLSQDRAGPVVAAWQQGGMPTSVLGFYLKTDLTADEFAKIEDSLTDKDGVNGFVEGRINVNTAPEAVLTCLPGINGTSYAATLISYRQGKTADSLKSLAWVADALGRDVAKQAGIGAWMTTRSYQFSADVAALGHAGHGMRRNLYVIETVDGAPHVIYHRDLGRLGWPLGETVSNELRQARQE